jgi:Cu/Ag efflux protein CusF
MSGWKTAWFVALALGLAASMPALAQHPAEQDGHGGDAAGVPAAGQAAGIESAGVVNAIDRETRTVNLTHEPIPALGWPSMTMDMGVAEEVDLSTVEAGEHVQFTLERGADSLYMITGIVPVD